MNWLVIVIIYCYTIGLLLCFYAGTVFEQKNPKPKMSARVIRPANITIVEDCEIKPNGHGELDFPPTKKVG